MSGSPFPPHPDFVEPPDPDADPGTNGRAGPDLSSVPMTPAAWATRKLDPPDFLLGDLLRTTSRILFAADTGLGKSMLGLAIGFAMRLGRDFLHWKAQRPADRAARVLVLDGEMPRDLLQERIKLACEWFDVDLAEIANGLYILSREDVKDMPPIDSEEGHTWLLAVIDQVGGVDFVIHDNVMALTSGDLREETTWRGLIPLSRELSRRKIGQLWLHHVGHDKSRPYGSRLFAWQMDTVVLGEAVSRDSADVSMRLAFQKCRRRTPGNRSDFASVHVVLEEGKWSGTIDQSGGSPASGKPSSLTPAGKIALKALDKAIAANGTAPPAHYATVGVKNAVKVETWRRYHQQTAGYGNEPKDREAERKSWNRGRENVQALGLAFIWGEWAWRP